MSSWAKLFWTKNLNFSNFLKHTWIFLYSCSFLGSSCSPALKKTVNMTWMTIATRDIDRSTCIPSWQDVGSWSWDWDRARSRGSRLLPDSSSQPTALDGVLEVAKLENDHVHLLCGPLHEELIEFPVEEEEGAGEAEGGQQVVLLLCHQHSVSSWSWDSGSTIEERDTRSNFICLFCGCVPPAKSMHSNVSVQPFTKTRNC